MIPKPGKKIRLSKIQKHYKGLRVGTRKKNRPTISRLKAELDRIFSWYIRLRDQQCVTCGQVMGFGTPKFADLTCGHFQRRGKNSLRWDTSNCNGQCNRCNGLHEYNTETYRQWIEENRPGLIARIRGGIAGILFRPDVEWYQFQIGSNRSKVSFILSRLGFNGSEHDKIVFGNPPRYRDL